MHVDHCKQCQLVTCLMVDELVHLQSRYYTSALRAKFGYMYYYTGAWRAEFGYM